jgi:hypothetical protein
MCEDSTMAGRWPLPSTAARNLGTPRRRSSRKRLRPFCHCRQSTSGAAAVSTHPSAQAPVAFGRSQNTAASPAGSALMTPSAWGGSRHASVV